MLFRSLQENRKVDVPSVVQDLWNHLQCTVCTNLISEPRVMRCGHAFCLKCIDKWFKETMFTTCPSCRKMDIVGRADALSQVPLLETILQDTQTLNELVKPDSERHIITPQTSPQCGLCFEPCGLPDGDDNDATKSPSTQKKAKYFWFDIHLAMYICSTWIGRASCRERV